MSLFQCAKCGCIENTALSPCSHKSLAPLFDWEGIEAYFGALLCSACSPTKYKDGTFVEGGGKWHGEFNRSYLPKGMFITDRFGNLAHKETGAGYRGFESAVKEEGE